MVSSSLEKEPLKRARLYRFISADRHSLTTQVLQILYWSTVKTEFSAKNNTP